MAACFWYVLCLPAFFFTAFGSVPAPTVPPCVKGWFEKCEPDHSGRVPVVGEEGSRGSQFFDQICFAMQTLSACMRKECQEPNSNQEVDMYGRKKESPLWDSNNNFFVHQQLQFSEANGICGYTVQTNACSPKIAKKCLNKMAKSIEKRGNFCDYYLAYAKCAIAELPACKDPTATTFVKEMKGQVHDLLPLVVGNQTFRLCSPWMKIEV